MSLFGSRLAWPAGHDTGEGTDFEGIRVADVRTGRASLVVRPRRDEGQTTWVRGQGDYLVYVDADAAWSDDKPAPSWRIMLRNLRTGRSSELAHQQGQEPPPWPQIEYPFVAFTRTYSVEIVDLRTAESVILAKGLVQPDIALGGSQLIVATGSPGHRDLYLANIATKKPKLGRVTRTGDIGWIAAGPAGVAYTRPGRESDPTSLFFLAKQSSVAVTVAGANAGNIVVGDGLLAYLTLDDGVVVYDTERKLSLEVIASHANIAARLSLDGRRLAWGTSLFRSGRGYENILFVASVLR